MHSLNVSLFYMINGLAGQHQWLDQFFVGLTYYGIGVLTVVLMYYLFWVVPGRMETAIARLYAYTHATMIVVTTGVAWGIARIIKVLAHTARPVDSLPHVHVLIIQGDYAFPSLHATLALALATGVYLYYPRLGRWILVLAVLIAFSRVYVGVHYPLDVLVGGLIGVLIPLILHRVFSPISVNPANQ